MPIGDQAIGVYFQEEISPQVNHQVHQLGKWIKQQQIEGITEVIPAYRTLTVAYNPFVLSYSELVKEIEDGSQQLERREEKIQKILEIPVCYDEEYGLDLKDLVRHTGFSIEEVIARHTSKPYYIYMLGFLPGFPYLGGMDASIAMPRLANPRTQIEAGSVGIAGAQTGVYTMNSPGGWRIIGKTPVTLFDANREEPIPYLAGEWIQFRAISKKTFVEIKEEVSRGAYKWKRKEIIHDT